MIMDSIAMVIDEMLNYILLFKNYEKKFVE